jgi:hypothetical protein
MDVRKSQLKRRGAEVAEAVVKRLLCCGFPRTGWWRIGQEIKVFSMYEYHMFYVLYPFVTCLLTLPRTSFLFFRVFLHFSFPFDIVLPPFPRSFVKLFLRLRQFSDKSFLKMQNKK